MNSNLNSKIFLSAKDFCLAFMIILVSFCGYYFYFIREEKFGNNSIRPTCTTNEELIQQVENLKNKKIEFDRQTNDFQNKNKNLENKMSVCTCLRFFV